MYQYGTTLSPIQLSCSCIDNFKTSLNSISIINYSPISLNYFKLSLALGMSLIDPIALFLIFSLYFNIFFSICIFSSFSYRLNVMYWFVHSTWWLNKVQRTITTPQNKWYRYLNASLMHSNFHHIIFWIIARVKAWLVFPGPKNFRFFFKEFSVSCTLFNKGFLWGPSGGGWRGEHIWLTVATLSWVKSDEDKDMCL